MRPSLRATVPALLAVLALLLGLSFAAACARPDRGPATPPPPEPAADRSAAAPRAPAPPAGTPSPGETPPAVTPAPPGADLPDGPIRLRIGLASDQGRVSLPCCGDHLVAESGGQRLAVTSPTTVEPAGDLAQRAVYRLQVAALRDESRAAALAADLERRWGWPADAHFDAGDGLYKVRLGRFPDRAPAETAQRRLAAAGGEGGWIVQEGGDLTAPALRVVRGGRSARVAGRWLRVRSLRDDHEAAALSWGGGRYRGDLLVFLNDRGSLNVINELELEQYLRGVVPAEMGPVQYDRLEALKAQAVAARTYTLRHLGGFVAEGYDLCATPRCQVYGGRDAEHPLSDRAVAATEGQVMLFAGEPVDARYSATCGGHTEDVEVIFPDEEAPYLRGVPCVEAGAVRVAAAVSTSAAAPGPGATLAAAVSRRLVPPPRTSRPLAPAAELTVRLEALAVRAGLPVPRRGRLRSTARRDVERFVSSLFDLALGPRVLLARDDLPRVAAAPPAEWSDAERRQAALLLAAGLYGDGADEERVEGEAMERLLFHLAALAGVVEEERASFRAAAPDEGELRLLPHGAVDERRITTAGLGLFRGSGDAADAVAADRLDLVPGDPLTVWSAGGRPLALVLDLAAAAPPADPPHRRASWVRFRGDAELARLVADRYPGFRFSRFEVLSRGVSGRVGSIRLHRTDGPPVVVEGLAVRWTLDVPDTRFQVERVRGGYRFVGRGWGHGVGLCQMGSYALAGRGVGYRDILRHYYSGVELVRARPRAPRWVGRL